MKMASGGKLLHEGRTEKLLSRILPEVSSSTEDENDRNPSPPPFKVPDGLRSLLNELSKEVLKSRNMKITFERNKNIVTYIFAATAKINYSNIDICRF